jgi:hypothetical protein
MDDELIETFHPGSGRSTGEFERPDEAREYVDPDPPEEIDAAQIKEFEFDWSPNGVVSTPEPEEPEVSEADLPAEDKEHEAELHRVSDDPESSEPQARESEAPPTDFDWSSRSIVSETPEPTVEESHVNDIESASEQMYESDGDEDVAPPAAYAGEPIAEDAVPVVEHGGDDVRAIDQQVDESTGTSTNERAELIELIAQRVIEKLSDNVIRDVAKEAVPRIAEKLIREALEDEKNR